MAGVKEPSRDLAITLLARGLASGYTPNEQDFRKAAGIVDAISTHTIETYRALIRAEVELEAEAAKR